MVGKIRRLEISLAAKCQILFGAAVVLIIAAALLVPWQRMEQLTEQLDERAAAALADDVLARHVAGAATPSIHPSDRADESDDDRVAGAAAGTSSTQPTAGKPAVPARVTVQLIPVGGGQPLSKFDRKALLHFARDRDSDP